MLSGGLDSEEDIRWGVRRLLASERKTPPHAYNFGIFEKVLKNADRDVKHLLLEIYSLIAS